MPISLGKLCELLKQYGMSAVVEGDGDCQISTVATLEDAVAGQVGFLSNPKYEKLLQTTRASAVVLRAGVEAPAGLNLVRTEDPYAAITVFIVALHGYRKHRAPGTRAGTGTVAATATVGEGAIVYPGVTVDEDATIGRDAVIYPGVYVGPRARIGDNVLLYPNVVIYDDSVIGNRCTIHAGSVIGEDGLGYAPFQGRWIKIPQIGIVELGDDVEIGANCSIDRATLGRTKIGSGTKFSNLIAIGHGTQIGQNCMFVAQVGLAGSVNVGNSVTMAGQVGVVGHIRVGDNAKVGAKAGVTNNVPDGETVLGQPAIPIRDMKRQVAYTMRLPELNQTVRQLERRIAELEARLNGQAGTTHQA